MKQRSSARRGAVVLISKVGVCGVAHQICGPEFAANAVTNICCFTNSRHAAPSFSTSAHVKPYSCWSAFASLCLPLQEQDARVHRPRYPQPRFDSSPSSWNRFRTYEAGGLVCAGKHVQVV